MRELIFSELLLVDPQRLDLGVALALRRLQQGELGLDRLFALVELAAGKLGQTSATYLFRCATPDGSQTLARGHRVIVKIGPDGRPVPWSPEYREIFRSLAVSDA